jgi:hypothetical protein
MRVLHLYRPRLPGIRAQAIQVVHVCEALARAGHTVTLLADRGPGATTPAAALLALGLTPHPGLDLRIAPVTQPGLAGLWFRAAVAAWMAGPPGLILARDKRRLVAAVGPRCRHAVALETHELDSALVADRGEDPAPVRALEAAALARADLLVANCGGTLAAWEDAWGPRLPAARGVLHNAIAPSRARPVPQETARVVRGAGSLRAMKGIGPALRAAADAGLSVEWIGGDDAERAALGALPAAVRLLPACPYPAVPDALATARVLLVPLQDNRFGRALTSPLKVWDALATPRPIVAPDLPTLREIAALTGAPLHLHPPGDAAALAAAVRAAAAAPPRPAVVRTWDTRQAELARVLAAAGVAL